MILRERPLFVVPPTTKQSPKDIIISLVSQLSPEQRDQFNALSYHAHSIAKNDEIPLAKFQTNAISAGDKVGIFPKTARLNHGCSSAFNVAYSWRNDEQVLGMTYPLSYISALTSFRQSRIPSSPSPKGRNCSQPIRTLRSLVTSVKSPCSRHTTSSVNVPYAPYHLRNLIYRTKDWTRWPSSRLI